MNSCTHDVDEHACGEWQAATPQANFIAKMEASYARIYPS
jgi:hypothetical protein